MNPAPPRLSAPLLALAGGLIASISAVCGVGGGIFAVPTLHYLFGMPLKRSVATGLCLVWSVASFSTVTEFLQPDSALLWGVIVLLIAGVLIGTQIGYELARRLPTRTLKGIFCVGLALGGARILAGSGGFVATLPAAQELGIRGSLTVFGIGLGAGVIVPMLGVGGGLVIVPALLIGLPQVGLLGARATSLAAAVVSSSRSLWLYQRDGMVDWRTGGWFGSGAAAGAVAGVFIVHREGGASIGKVLLGVVLLFAALRFGLDLLRSGTEENGVDRSDPG